MNEERLRNAAAVSPRWLDWRRRIDIDEYDARFERHSGSSGDAHGEADFLASLGIDGILDAGCGTGRIAIELSRRGFDVVGVDLDADMIAAAARKAPEQTWLVGDLASVQLDRRFGVIAMAGNVMIFCKPDDRGSIVANMADHLASGGRLVAGFTLERDGYTLAEWDEHCLASGLTVEAHFATWSKDPFQQGGDYHVSVHRRAG
ncbi:MAG: class I SAM-dependent methyltransferase [Ilumatobacteraceae bacterium]